MSGAIPPLPQYAFMEWCSLKAQGQLYHYIHCPTSNSANLAPICNARMTAMFELLKVDHCKQNLDNLHMHELHTLLIEYPLIN
jgi:hypothetical protein